jgi:hypothetical protein
METRNPPIDMHAANETKTGLIAHGVSGNCRLKTGREFINNG